MLQVEYCVIHTYIHTYIALKSISLLSQMSCHLITEKTSKNQCCRKTISTHCVRDYWNVIFENRYIMELYHNAESFENFPSIFRILRRNACDSFFFFVAFLLIFVIIFLYSTFEWKGTKRRPFRAVVAYHLFVNFLSRSLCVAYRIR